VTFLKFHPSLILSEFNSENEKALRGDAHCALAVVRRTHKQTNKQTHKQTHKQTDSGDYNTLCSLACSVKIK